MRQRSGPSLEHAVLAVRLKGLRKGAGRSVREAARALGASTATVTRIERAETALDPGQVLTLLEYYRASPELVDQYMTGIAAANLPGWWHPYRSVMEPWQQDIMAIESAARMIRTWHPALVPALLRTPLTPTPPTRPSSPAPGTTNAAAGPSC